MNAIAGSHISALPRRLRLRTHRGKRDSVLRIKVRYTKRWTYIALIVQGDHGSSCGWQVRVDNEWVRRNLEKLAREHNVKLNFRVGDEVGGFFGNIWKGVKKVAKKVGLKKIIGVAKKALPIASALPPPVGPAAMAASAAINSASDIAKALKSHRKGKKAAAGAYLARAARTSRRVKKKLGRRKGRRAMKAGARIYRIMVEPT